MGKDPEHTHEEDLDETSDDAALAAALAAAQGDAEVWEGGDGGREVEIEKDEVDSQRCPHIHQASPDKIKGKIFMTCVACIGGAKPKKGYENKKSTKKTSKKSNKPEETALWICAACGNLGCGRESPWKHAELHAKSGQKHQLAIQWEPRTLIVWCYECDDEVFVDESAPSRNLRDCLTILQGGKPPPTQKETDAMSKKQKRQQDKKAKQQTLHQQAKSQKQQNNQHMSDDVESSHGGDVSLGKGIKGLHNLGNTCFFNSVLQNLAHTRRVLDYYIAKENDTQKEVQGSLNLALQETMNLIWAGEGKGGKVSPTNLFNAIAKQFVIFRRKQQQDAHELLCCLLDGMASEEKENKKGKSEFTRSTFGGRLISTVTCHECHTASRTYEPYYILSLPIPLQGTSQKEDYEPEVRLSNAKLKRKKERELKQMKKAESAATTTKKQPSPTESTTNTNGKDTSNDTPANTTNGTSNETTNQITNQTTNGTSSETSDEKLPAENSNKTSNETNKPDETSVETSKTTSSEITNETSENHYELTKRISEDAAKELPAVANESSNQTTTETSTEIPTNQTPGDSKTEDQNDKNSISDNIAEQKENIDDKSEPATNNSTNEESTTNNQNENNNNTKKEEEARLVKGLVELRQWNTGAPLNRGKGGLSVLDCLMSFTDPEILEGKNAFGCSECTRRRTAYLIEIGGDIEDELLQEESSSERIGEKDHETSEDKESTKPEDNLRNDDEAEQEEKQEEKEADGATKEKEGDNEVVDKKEDAKDESHNNTVEQEDPAEKAEQHNTSQQGLSNKQRRKANKKHTKKQQPSPPSPSPPPSSSSSSSKKPSLVTCTATKQFLVDTPPPILVLHLKRFMQTKNSLQKISQNVSFSPSLDLTPFLDPHATSAPSSSSSSSRSPSPGSCEYKLTGVVEHSGGMGGGHYVAHFYNDADDTWYYASDTHVNTSSLETALKSEAYLLFYQKVGPPVM